MRLLLDQNFDRRLVRLLRDDGHDVTVVGVDYPPGLPDEEILAIGRREGRILLTNDRDFGELVVSRGLQHAGIVYLRMRETTAEGKWQRLRQVLMDHADDLHRFLVVTEGAVRVR